MQTNKLITYSSQTQNIFWNLLSSVIDRCSYLLITTPSKQNYNLLHKKLHVSTKIGHHQALHKNIKKLMYSSLLQFNPLKQP